MPDTQGVQAPRWKDGCSKIQPGECAWFHTGNHDSSKSWFLQDGMTCKAYANESFRDLDNSEFGSFDWSDYQGFAYHICRTSGSSSNCETNGDLQLSKICASTSDEDDVEIRHTFNQRVNSGMWYPLFQGKILSTFTPITPSPVPVCSESSSEVSQIYSPLADTHFVYIL